MTSSKTNISKTRKAALSIAAAAFAAALIGVGAYAEWSATTSEAQTVTAGSVDLASGVTEASMDASDVAPGDTIRRRVTLTNTGSLDLRTLTLASSGGATPGTIFTDTTNGLQLQIQKCTVAWAADYTCSGTTSSVYASGPVGISPAQDVAASLAADITGGVDNLLFTVSLPTTAPDTMEGQSVTITYTFDGLQRSGTSK
jgi:predicted ribosomally synthesized peptide with SipW-like signal peptide